MKADELLACIEARATRALNGDESAFRYRWGLEDILMDIEREHHGVHHHCIGDMLVAKNLTQATYIAAPEVDDMWAERDQQDFIERSG